jgi:hypothetical protein
MCIRPFERKEFLGNAMHVAVSQLTIDERVGEMPTQSSVVAYRLFSKIRPRLLILCGRLFVASFFVVLKGKALCDVNDREPARKRTYENSIKLLLGFFVHISMVKPSTL